MKAVFSVRLVSAATMAWFVVALASCGGSTPSVQPQQATGPAITSLEPPSSAAGADGFHLIIHGQNFLTTSSVTVAGATRAVTLTDSTKLSLLISSADLSAIGSLSVTVSNPGTAAAASSSFTVTEPSAPTVTSILPSSVEVSGAGFAMAVTGQNFVRSSTVFWNGNPRGTAYVDNRHLTATIPGTDLAVVGSASITVQTSTPGGGTSTAQNFDVIVPAPVLASLSRAQTVAGSGNLSLHVLGSKFATGITFLTNGASLNGTSLVNSGDASVIVPASVLKQVGIVQISAQNIGSAASNNLQLQVQPSGQPAKVTLLRNGPTNAGPLRQVITQISSSSFRAIRASTDLRYVAALAFDSVTSKQELQLVDTCIGVLSGCTVSSQLILDSSAFSQSHGAEFQISASGRFVVFITDASLDPADTNGLMDVYLRDTCAGASPPCTPQTELVSYAPNGVDYGGDFFRPAVSSDGRYIFFMTFLDGSTLNDGVHVRDTCRGATGCTPATTVIAPPPGWTRNVIGATSQLAISPNGRFVAWDNSDPGIPGSVLFADRCTGVSSSCVPATTNLSGYVTGPCGPGGCPVIDGTLGDISADGRFVVTFQSTVFDTCQGAVACTPSKQVLAPALGTLGYDSIQSISPDGRFWISSLQTPYYPTDTNTANDIFLWDTCLAVPAGCAPTDPAKPVWVSLSDTGAQGDDGSYYPAISPDGKQVLFLSMSDNLISSQNSLPGGLYVVKLP
jgi:hypothetical protein